MSDIGTVGKLYSDYVDGNAGVMSGIFRCKKIQSYSIFVTALLLPEIHTQYILSVRNDHLYNRCGNHVCLDLPVAE